MDDYGVNPVLQGLVQAFSMANVMKNQKMQQEHLQLQKNRDKRQEEHQQFSEGRQTLGDQMAALNTGAKPLDQNGQFSQESAMPSAVPGLGPASVHLGGIPGDPNRTAKIGNQNYQLANQQEQQDSAFGQKMREVDAAATIHSRSQLAAIDAKGKADQAERTIEVDGKSIDSRSIPLITERERTKAAGIQKDATIADNQLNRKSREGIADKNNASRERAAGLRERALTPNAQGVQERFDQREQEKARKDNTSDQAKEQALWGQYGDITTSLTNRQAIDPKTKEAVDLNPLTEAKLRNQADTIKKQIAVLQKAQKTRTEAFGGTYSNGAPQQGNPYKKSAPAVNPYR